MTAADRLERLTEQHDVVCDQLAQSMERIAELEAALEIALSVRMLDNLSDESWRKINAARRK